MTEKCAKNSPDLSDFGKEEIPSNVAFIPNENAQTMKMISTSKMVRSRVTATKYKVNESIYRQSFNQNCRAEGSPQSVINCNQDHSVS